MEMEDHHHHNNHRQQQYGITDLRQLVNGVPPATRSTSHHFPSIPTPTAQHPTAELFPGHPNLTAAAATQQQYEMMTMFGRQVADIMPRCLQEFGCSDGDGGTAAAGTNNSSIAVATTPTTTTSASTPPLSGLGAEAAGCLGGDASTGRWPRQETLTLLEIRSRLDLKFKEANQKGPLWDEVSRVMSEEHGYQRSGKKCREKFENLYKYYKKTKEGKAGRQDGKHYRFFRQLEALYGENSNPPSAPETNFATNSSIRYQTNNHHHHHHDSQTNNNQEMLMIHQSHHHHHHHNQKHCDSLSLTNSTDLDTSSSDDNDHHSTDIIKDNDSAVVEKRMRKRGGGSGNRSWKVKIKDFIDLQMRKLVEKQEEWLEKLMKTMEQKEKERVLREEEWRRQEASRLEKEHKFWAKERAWIEARDAALMEALQKLTGSDHEVKAHHHHHHHHHESPEGIIASGGIHNQNEDGSEILENNSTSWPEPEIARLLQLRAEIMETRFRQGGGFSEDAMWDEIANKMACFGYERRSPLMLKEKWESITSYPNPTRNVIAAANHKELGSKKRKDNSRNCFYFDNNDHHHQSSLYNQGGSGGGYCDINDQRQQTTNDGSSPSNSNVGNAVPATAPAPADSCFPFLMSSSEGGSLWDNYSLKVNKANQNQ